MWGSPCGARQVEERWQRRAAGYWLVSQGLWQGTESNKSLRGRARKKLAISLALIRAILGEGSSDVSSVGALLSQYAVSESAL